MKACVQYLGFDDRWLIRIGIPLFSLTLPILLNFDLSDKHSYWTHHVPISFIHVIGFWAFYRYLFIYLHRRFPKDSETKKRLGLEIGLIFLTAPLLYLFFEVIILNVLRLCHDHFESQPGLLLNLLVIYLPSALILAIYEANYFFAKYKESLVERENLQKIHVQTQLDNLRNQINPHFLFNSLNTLMNLIPTDPNAAMDYLSKLSRFYRGAVGNKEDTTISLQKEIENARLFADLLEVRFNSGLKILFPENVDSLPSTRDYLLPMSLQLLIENAVKHNIVSKSQPLTITIAINQELSYITVINNLQSKIESVKSTGMGLNNIKERYSYFTDKEVICSNDNNIFQVSLPILKSR